MFDFLWISLTQYRSIFEFTTTPIRRYESMKPLHPQIVFFFFFLAMTHKCLILDALVQSTILLIHKAPSFFRITHINPSYFTHVFFILNPDHIHCLVTSSTYFNTCFGSVKMLDQYAWTIWNIYIANCNLPS